jgi:hypothetical protein
MTIWNILWPFGISYGRLVWFVVNCYIFSQFGMFGPEKSGNPAQHEECIRTFNNDSD